MRSPTVGVVLTSARAIAAACLCAMLAACGPSSGSAARGEWREPDDAAEDSAADALAPGAGVVAERHGWVDLNGADCRPIGDSSFISQLCFIRPTAQVVATLRGKHYLLCNMSQGQFFDWLAAPSKGSYFNEEVKGRHDC